MGGGLSKQRGMEPGSSDTVFGCTDLVTKILELARLSPVEFVWCGRVCRMWRAVCHTDDHLLFGVALGQDFLTKRALMGMFALSPAEADKLPRGVCARVPTGFMYMYSEAAVRAALPLVGGLAGWRRRVEGRGRTERPISQKRPLAPCGGTWVGSHVKRIGKRVRSC
jgi:hypothetical protein